MISGIRQTNLAKLANALGTSPETLMGWDEDEEKIKNPSEEVRLIEKVERQYGKNTVELLAAFVQLNEDGQKKAVSQLQDLLDVPKYRKEE